MQAELRIRRGRSRVNGEGGRFLDGRIMWRRYRKEKDEQEIVNKQQQQKQQE